MQRCRLCGGDLRHELISFLVEGADASYRVCPSCVSLVLARLDAANREAGELLESWWVER
jgi:hypothetical protein